MPKNFVDFLKGRLIFILFYCFWIFVKKLFTCSRAQISKRKRCFNVKFSIYIFMWRRRYWQIFKSALVYPKPGFTADNNPNDRSTICLKLHAFEHSEWFAFCHVFRLSVTYIIGIKYFDVVFLLSSPKKLSCFRRKLFCNGAILLVVILVYHCIFFPKKLQR